jgi:demethoxyubiquinone hydroxylase (CLK1/Coq7/Cat5 family)
MSQNQLYEKTIQYIRDLHARECMRLGWYRQWQNREKIKRLRERKSIHTAFLHDLLRKRGLQPAWYSKWFYWLGHLFGFITALLPISMANFIEKNLEKWILIRYEKYLEQLKLDYNLRSMIEAIQLKKLNHNEPSLDVIQFLEICIMNEENLLKS